MKLKCPNLLKPLETIIQENYQPFYPSEPIRFTRFQMRHPVEPPEKIRLRLIKMMMALYKIPNTNNLSAFRR